MRWHGPPPRPCPWGPGRDHRGPVPSRIREMQDTCQQHLGGGVECLWLLAVPMASAWWHCWALPFQNGDEPVGPHGRKVVPPGREGDRERSSVAAKFGSMLYLFIIFPSQSKFKGLNFDNVNKGTGSYHVKGSAPICREQGLIDIIGKWAEWGGVPKRCSNSLRNMSLTSCWQKMCWRGRGREGIINVRSWPEPGSAISNINMQTCSKSHGYAPWALGGAMNRGLPKKFI